VYSYLCFHVVHYSTIGEKCKGMYRSAFSASWRRQGRTLMSGVL
jgi:hypothetical protein